jgi:hypothetical protein
MHAMSQVTNAGTAGIWVLAAAGRRRRCPMPLPLPMQVPRRQHSLLRAFLLYAAEELLQACSSTAGLAISDDSNGRVAAAASASQH